MINYNNADNFYRYDTNAFNDSRYSPVSSCNGMPNYGYCPYAAYNNSLQNYPRNNCPYNNNDYFQYSPTVNCINPAYPREGSFNAYGIPNYGGELKMRTVSIEDIRD